MFDFSFVFSAKPLRFFPCNEHHQFLHGIDYQHKEISGKNWKGECFYHSDQHDETYAYEREVHCFLLGSVQKNKLFHEKLYFKDKTLSPSLLIELYLKMGSSLIEVIKGTFLLVICDEKNEKIFAFTNRSGMYRLYYKQEGDKLYISSSLRAVVQNLGNEPKLDNVALIQHGLFQYPLGERTFFKGIKCLDNYSFIEYDFQSLQINRCFAYHDLLNKENKMSRKAALAEISTHFERAMQDILVDDVPFNAALTGGYDSRCILAYVLNEEIKDYRLYTWAADKRWEDAKVAENIAESLNLQYDLIELGEEMLESYPDYCDKQVYWSDGFGSINRANQMYSHTFLSKYSRNLVSGYFGSELFRPMHISNVMISPMLTELIFSDQRAKYLENIYNHLSLSAYQEDFLTKHKNEFFEDTLHYLESLDLCEKKHLTFFHYIVKTGFWKFFGQEIHAQRINTNITSPFMDDDFLSFIARSKLIEVHRSTYKGQSINAFKGQSVYHPILENLYPKLMTFPTNRGFAPKDFNSLFFPLNVVLKHQLSRRRQKRSGIIGFNSKNWNIDLFKQRKEILDMQNEIFKPLNSNDSSVGFWYSLKWYLSLNSKICKEN